MSDTGGVINRGGKRGPLVVLKISGKVPDRKWPEFLEDFKQLTRKYPDLKVEVLGQKKKTKKKKKR